jgi:hypothetical protein
MFERFRSAWFNRQRKAWEKKRKKGKRSYLLYRGVLRWGGFMFGLTACSDVYIRHEKLDWSLGLSLLIGCLLVGFVWALCIWNLNERRYGYMAGR